MGFSRDAFAHPPRGGGRHADISLVPRRSVSAAGGNQLSQILRQRRLLLRCVFQYRPIFRAELRVRRRLLQSGRFPSAYYQRQSPIKHRTSPDDLAQSVKILLDAAFNKRQNIRQARLSVGNSSAKKRQINRLFYRNCFGAFGFVIAIGERRERQCELLHQRKQPSLQVRDIAVQA